METSHLVASGTLDYWLPQDGCNQSLMVESKGGRLANNCLQIERYNNMR